MTEPQPTEATVWLAACAWCKRVHLGERWVTEAEVFRAFRNFDYALRPSFTHTICSSCFEQVERPRPSPSS
jgi:hypothetical protein